MWQKETYTCQKRPTQMRTCHEKQIPEDLLCEKRPTYVTERDPYIWKETYTYENMSWETNTRGLDFVPFVCTWLVPFDVISRPIWVCTCMHMYMYMYAYVYVRMCMYICMCTCIYLYMFICIDVYMCVCMYIHIHTWLASFGLPSRFSIPIHTHVYMYICIYAYVYMYICLLYICGLPPCLCVHMYTCIHVYTYTYI